MSGFEPPPGTTLPMGGAPGAHDRLIELDRRVDRDTRSS